MFYTATKRIDAAVARGEPPPKIGAPLRLTTEDVLSVTQDPDPFEGLKIPPELQKYIDDLSSELKFARAIKWPAPPIKHTVFVGPRKFFDDL